MGKALAFFLALSVYSAQAVESPSEQIEQPVQENFRKVDKKWLVESVLVFPFYSFYLGAPAIRGVAYLPNFAPRLGPRIIYNNYGAVMTFALPIPEREIERRGDSRQDHFIFNSYWRQNAYDIYYQRIRGFYVNSPLTELSASKPDRFPQLPDTRVLNMGINWYFVFSPQRYSLKAAFDQNEFQLRSGGSWLLNPFYTHFEMFLGERFVPSSNGEGLSELPNVASGRFDTTGMAVGYGYTYVYKHFFATGQAAWGPGVQFQRIQRSDGNDSEVWSFAAKLNVNLAGGWNYDEYVGGMKVLVDSLWAEVEDTQLSSSLVSVQFFFGQRF